jgi:peptidoglycan hydrolase CwlO-like protein
MIKKFLLAGMGVVVLGSVLYGTDFWSYVRTAQRQVAGSLKESVPIEFEIQRARQMIDDLVPDIERNMHLIAEQEVDVEDLERAMAQQQQELERQRSEILVLRSRLQEQPGPYRFAGRTFTEQDIRRDLALRYGRYKTAEQALAAKRELLQARRRQLEESRRKLDHMIAAKRALEVQVEELESRLRALQAAQAASNVQFDDSRLAKVKALVTELRKRLDVAERLLAAEGKLTGEIPVTEEAETENIVEVIDRELGGPGQTAQRGPGD